ncbi:MAG: hypothetical protein B7Z53_01925 [Rhodospirillales bacterium 12-71-4]|nr:MAG: hypothetical protein B7Z53_01925 [Rhodospirillales bacterium 12-71-4]
MARTRAASAGLKVRPRPGARIASGVAARVTQSAEAPRTAKRWRSTAQSRARSGLAMTSRRRRRSSGNPAATTVDLPYALPGACTGVAAILVVLSLPGGTALGR